MRSKRKSVTTYLVLCKSSGRAWDKPVLARRLTSKRPRLAKNEIAIKLTIDLPGDIFEEAIPSVTISVPDSAVISPDDVVMEVLEDVE